LDIKSILNKIPLRRVPFEIRVAACVAIWWFVILRIADLEFYYYWPNLIFRDVLECMLWLAVGGIALFFSNLAAPWKIVLKEKNLALVVFGFAALSAGAGISAWKLSTWHNHYEEKWYVLYEVVYVIVILPNAWTRINNMNVGYRAALEEQMKSERLKSELITNVSHDLKTPLTSIINYVNLLKQKELSPEEARSYVEVLDRKSTRLKTLIEDLFEASKVASGAVELDIRQIDVSALLNQTLAELGDTIDDVAPFIRVKIAQPHIFAFLDGNKTQRVFENLIGNARKYSLPGTRIYISLEEKEDRIAFRIQNTSSYEIDFAAEEFFERFKRADESRHSEGSGLGLAIAKSIVDLQGGRIRIDIQGDQFNVFIDFPKIQSR